MLFKTLTLSLVLSMAFSSWSKSTSQKNEDACVTINKDDKEKTAKQESILSACKLMSVDCPFTESYGNFKLYPESKYACGFLANYLERDPAISSSQNLRRKCLVKREGVDYPIPKDFSELCDEVKEDNRSTEIWCSGQTHADRFKACTAIQISAHKIEDCNHPKAGSIDELGKAVKKINEKLQP